MSEKTKKKNNNKNSLKLLSPVHLLYRYGHPRRTRDVKGLVWDCKIGTAHILIKLDSTVCVILEKQLSESCFQGTGCV